MVFLKNKPLSLFILLTLTITTFNSCKKEGSSEPAPVNQVTYEEVLQNVISPQEAYYSVYVNLLSVMDTVSALDSVVKLFRSNSSVSWAEKTLDGINVQYKNGIRGGIITNDIALNKSQPVRGGQDNAERGKTLFKSHTNVTPLSKKTIIISMFGLESDSLGEAFYQWLPEIGFEQPVYHIGLIYQDDLERFKNLTDYGIIYISSGGRPWPGNNNIQESYLLTKIIPDDYIINKYAADLIVGNLSIFFHMLYGRVVYVGTNFIHSYSNFEINKPLIIGSFGFSLLGELSRKIAAGNKGAFVGYDWYIYDFSEFDWANHLFYCLSESQMNLLEWYNTPYPKVVTNNRGTTNINYKGPDNFSLCTGPNWPWRYVNINFSDVNAICSLSTGGTYNWDNLGFGHPYQYTKFSADGSTLTAEWDTTYEGGYIQRGSLSVTVDTINLSVKYFTAGYYYEHSVDGKVYEKQSMEVQGQNIPSVFKSDKSMLNEIRGTGACDAVNHFTFTYTQNPGTANESTTKLFSYSCDQNSSVTISWYKDPY